MVNPRERVQLLQIRENVWLNQERNNNNNTNNNNNNNDNCSSDPVEEKYSGLLTLYPIDSRHSSHSYPNCSLAPKYPLHSKPISVPFNPNSRRHDFNSLSSSYSSL